jgi:hypothetical protein
MSTIETIPRLPRVRACEKFEGCGKFCRACFWRRPLHKRFQSVTCSQCGGEFGPANEGYSMCSQHGGRR